MVALLGIAVATARLVRALVLFAAGYDTLRAHAGQDDAVLTRWMKYWAVLGTVFPFTGFVERGVILDAILAVSMIPMPWGGEISGTLYEHVTAPLFSSLLRHFGWLMTRAADKVSSIARSTLASALGLCLHDLDEGAALELEEAVAAAKAACQMERRRRDKRRFHHHKAELSRRIGSGGSVDSSGGGSGFGGGGGGDGSGRLESVAEESEHESITQSAAAPSRSIGLVSGEHKSREISFDDAVLVDSPVTATIEETKQQHSAFDPDDVVDDTQTVRSRERRGRRGRWRGRHSVGTYLGAPSPGSGVDERVATIAPAFFTPQRVKPE